MNKLCGATDEQKQAQKEEAKLAQDDQAVLKVLTQQQSQVFAEDQAILKGLQDAWKPIVDASNAALASLMPTIEAGPNAPGYTPAQEAAMRTQATEQTAGASDQAVRTIDVQSGANSDSYVPSGATDQLRAMTRQEGLNANSQLQTGITEKGAELGLEKYNSALQAAANAGSPLQSMAGSLSTVQMPAISAGNAVTGAANAATGGASASMSGATDIANANNAWMGPVFGMLGGIGAGALSKIANPAGKSS